MLALTDLFAEHAKLLAAFGLFLLVAIYLSLPKKTNGKLPPVLNYMIPILGSFPAFAKDPIQMVLDGYKEKGSCFTAKMFGQDLTFLIGPKAHESFYKPNDDYLSQSEVYQLMTPVFGPGLVYDATPKRRAQQMQFMANGLRTSRLKTYVEKIRMETELYFKAFPKESTVSLKKIFSEVTILTASRALLGDEVRENLFKEVSSLYCDLDGGTTPLSFFFPYLPIPMHRRRDAARKKMSDLFSGVIKQRRESGKRADDILDTFMNSEYKDTPGVPIPNEHIVGLLIALLFAGQHTSSLTVTWAVIELVLQTPEMIPKILKEQDEVLGEGGSDNLNFDTVNNMPILHACIKETLRLTPPLIFLMRKVMKDITCNEYTIPAGHIVFSSPAAACRLPDYWAEPDKYDPMRFLDGRNEEDRQPYTNVSFGGGMHGCMGQQYAYIQVKIVLSIFFRLFKVEMVDKTFPKQDYTCLVVPPVGETLAKLTRVD
ncbi:hypothetical protein SPRG_09493 [Saprolegnia parasitica CBS 223.65]|uniref:Cytochrome P450 n=2 Tax=Saprolegnia parasitica (strain CBS 223.65) TaxID=695850 RepID=A0A067CFD8_SAPPC|nr:hypothetical protein SPRG_09493 [Saprolegnia parasitica CBS 223.65]KDO25246.1 hypothetical protein SPRG_09493 [Saprolegnia parasitica CBS 223.65]|eukprot:XP_012204080.1 hypothetical protein SPRG_09493 [Saprolegnia parasitica CBS 223.65]